MARISFSQIIADRARAAPDSALVIDVDSELTAAELDERATSLAHALIDRGVKVDDLVSVALPNGRDFVIACAGIWRAGATPQLVSPVLTDQERRHLDFLSGTAASIGVPPSSGSGAWLEDVHVAANTRPLPDLAARCWKAPATSGSTGRPKIVKAAAPALLDPTAPVAPFLPREATQLVAGPLWHSAVFTYAFRGLLTGHRLVIMPRFDARQWIDLVETHHVTWGLLVPTMMSRLMRLPAHVRDAERVRTIERILHMGAACAPDLKRAVIAWLGPGRVDEVYAGSESNGLTFIAGDDWLEHPGSVGRAISGTRIRILDDNGGELPFGQAGTVWMHRGESPGYEYIGAQSRRDSDGWDTLGDIGQLDEAGYLYLHDRSDDMINRGGEKIAPATVEAVLQTHPNVIEAVAFGVAHEEWGEVVHAVVRADGPVAVAGLAQLATQQLGRRAPAVIHVTDQALRNEAGKVRRADLGARFAMHG